MTQQINKRLIAFTGPDGIGKTTQAGLLVDWINSEDFRHKYNYYNASYIKELNEYTYVFKSFRDLVYSLYKQVDVITLANVIKLNRYLLQDLVTIDLEEYFDNITVVDRWNVCTYCYLKAKDVDEETALSYLTDEHTLIPGLTIMLVGINGALRTGNRVNNNNMFEDTEDDFKSKLAHTYIDFDEDIYSGKIVKINNDELSKDETQYFIRKAVLQYLTGRSIIK